MQVVLQATICDCLALDPFAFEEDGLSASEVDVGNPSQDSNVRFDPLSCSPFQVASAIILCSRASGSEWPLLSRAGGTIIKTTVDQALMRGLDTAGPVMRRGASSV